MLEYLYWIAPVVFTSICAILVFLFKDFLNQKRKGENVFKEAAIEFKKAFEDDYLFLRPSNDGVAGDLRDTYEYWQTLGNKQIRAACDFSRVLSNISASRLHETLDKYHRYCAKENSVFSLLDLSSKTFKTDVETKAKRKIMFQKLNNVLAFSVLQRRNIVAEFSIYLKNLIYPFKSLLP